MYAKMLVPGPPSVPALVATSAAFEVLGQLLAQGWSEYGQPPAEPDSCRLLITHRSLQLFVAGDILLDDLDPAAPPGWWPAVDRLDGRCVVVVISPGLIDLSDRELGVTLRQLMDRSGTGVWAVVPVEHPARPLAG